MANLHAKVLVTSILSMAVTVNSVSAGQTVSSISAVPHVESHISATYEIIPQKELARQYATVTEVQRFDMSKVLIDISLVTESMAMSFYKSLDDSVVVSDAVNKIINTSADFDPSDADVDFDPITVSDSKLFGVGKSVSDTVISTDINSKLLERPMQENISATDSKVAFVGKPLSETTEVTEEMGKYLIRPNVVDVTTVLELAAKDFSTGKVDNIYISDTSYIDVGKNVAEIADTSEVLGPFTVGKSLVDTPEVSESIAKEFTRPDITDYVAADDGVSIQPNLNKAETVVASEIIDTKHIQPAYAESVSATDTFVPVLTIGGDSSILNNPMVNEIVLNG